MLLGKRLAAEEEYEDRDKQSLERLYHSVPSKFFTMKNRTFVARYLEISTIE
jgi:hypothetical protein